MHELIEEIEKEILNTELSLDAEKIISSFVKEVAKTSLGPLGSGIALSYKVYFHSVYSHSLSIATQAGFNQFTYQCF